MMYSPARYHRRRARQPNGRTKLGVGGGLVLATGGLFGFWTADQLHRMSVTYKTTDTNQPTLPAGLTLAQYNDAAVAARPTWQSQAWQWGTVLFTGVLGLFVPWRWAKLFLYGTSIGAGLHATYQLVTGYIILPVVAGGATDSWGQRAYAYELAANYALGKMTKPASTTQGRLGAPPGTRALPAHAAARVPVSLATGMPATVGALATSPFPHGTPAALGANAMPGGFLGQTSPPGSPAPGAPFPPPGWTLKQVANSDQCPAGGIYRDFGADGKWCAIPPAAPPAPPSPPMTTPPTPPPGSPPTGGPPPPTPPTPPVATPMPPPPAPQPACPLPWASTASPNQPACCGTTPCSCGVNSPTNGLPGTVLGQPPRPPSHPLFAMMLAPRRAA